MMLDYRDQRFERFLGRYANWDGLRSIAITFDIDWAPDYMIRHALEIVSRHGLRCTVFATHDSEFLRSLAGQDWVEVGIHPNLSPNSTQGSGLYDIVGALTGVYRETVGCRFHTLGFSYRDLLWLGTQRFEYDVSRILFNAPYLVPAWHTDLNMVLLPYVWEDGVCENQGLVPSLSSMYLQTPGLKILNFHPMNVYTNFSRREDRLAFQSENPNLLETPESVSLSYRRSGAGSGRALEELCAFIAENDIESVRVKDIAGGFPKALYGQSRA